MLRLREAAEFPFHGSKAASRLSLGGSLCALPIFVFTVLGYLVDTLKSSIITAPLCLLYLLAGGYAFNVFKAAFRQERVELAAWDHWGDLFSKGFFVFLIELGYGLPPLLLVAVGIGVLYRGGWWLFAGMLLLMIGMLAFLLVGFFFPMGIAQYLRWQRIEAAFHIPSLWGAIRHVLVEYVSLFLLSLLVLLAFGFVATIPFLGPVLASFLSFYPMVVLAKLFGEMCGR
ncbi:MAG: DUF4013 domain-containing protein [bacterium]|jgi:hypothetical protein